jgi:hypothetical protein
MFTPASEQLAAQACVGKIAAANATQAEKKCLPKLSVSSPHRTTQRARLALKCAAETFPKTAHLMTQTGQFLSMAGRHLRAPATTRIIMQLTDRTEVLAGQGVQARGETVRLDSNFSRRVGVVFSSLFVALMRTSRKIALQQKE